MNYIVVLGCRAAHRVARLEPAGCHGSPRISLYSRERAHSGLQTSSMVATVRCVSHLAVQPGWPGVRLCACFEVADGIWPGSQVAQPRKTPPDLGTQLYTMSRSSSMNIHQCRTYALSIFCLLGELHSICDTVILGFPQRNSVIEYSTGR
jgi:hypothetical protein